MLTNLVARLFKFSPDLEEERAKLIDHANLVTSSKTMYAIYVVSNAVVLALSFYYVVMGLIKLFNSSPISFACDIPEDPAANREEYISTISKKSVQMR